MNNQMQEVKRFMAELYRLSNRFAGRASFLTFPERVSVKMDTISLIDDVFSSTGSQTSYPITKLQSENGNAIDFITNTMDAMPPLYKVNFGTTKGLLEEAMYLPEFRLTEKGWIYFEPIDFDRFVTGGESRIEIPERIIDDHFIDKVLTSVFNGEKGNLLTSFE